MTSRNTRARSNEIAQAARTILTERGIDPLVQTVPLRELAPVLAMRVGCLIKTARQHLAKAARLARGEAAAEWGGARSGAGNPVLKQSTQTATLRLNARVIVQRTHGGPLEAATVTEILSGRPRVAVLALDAGGEIRITV